MTLEFEFRSRDFEDWKGLYALSIRSRDLLNRFQWPQLGGACCLLFAGPSSRAVPYTARSSRSVALCSRQELRLPISLSSWSSIQHRLWSLPRLAFQNEARTPVQHPTPRASNPGYSFCPGSKVGTDESGRWRPRQRAKQ